MMFLLTYPKRNESVFFYDFTAIWCEKSFWFEHICIWPIVWISKDPIQDWKYRCIFGNCVSLVIDIFQGFMRNCHGGNTTKSLYLHDTGIRVRQPNVRLLIIISWLFFWPEFLLEFMKNYNAICIYDRFFWRIVMKILSEISTFSVGKSRYLWNYWRILIREAVSFAYYLKTINKNIFNIEPKVLISQPE